MDSAHKRVAVAYDCFFPLSTGGGERQYRAFADELARRGHEVTYLTARHWEGEAPDAAFGVTAITGPLRLYDANGVRSGAAAVRFAAGLFGHLLRHRRDYDAIIVSGLPVLNVFAARAALIGAKTSVVIDYLEVWGRRQWRDYAGPLTGTLAWLAQRAAIALTPTATCHSQLSASRLIAEGLRTDPVVSPGLIDHVEPVPFTATPDVPPYVLYAGRHIPDKRVETLPAAVAEARRQVPDLRLVILGTGPSRPAVEDALAALGNPGWAELPGFVSQERLDALMAGATVLANPSRREGYGLVVVEAAGHGTPTVLVDHPGNASVELLTSGVNGFIASDDSPSTLGAALAEAAAGGSPLRVSTREWYDHAVKDRTIARTIDGIVDVLEKSR